MAMLRKMKVFVVLFFVAAILAGGFTTMTAEEATAARCCWVMKCTVNPPIVCWEECVRCPSFP